MKTMKHKSNGRQAFNFLLSYNRVVDKLKTEKQQCELLNIIRRVHFLQIKIDDVEISDPMVDLAYESIKHSLEKSIYAYLDKAKPEDMGVYGVSEDSTQVCTPHSTPHSTQQEEEKEEVKEEVKEKGDLPFTFTLKKLTTVDNLDIEYLDKLKTYINEYILNLENKAIQHNIKLAYTLEYEEFIDGLLSSGKKYKDFSATYRNWHKMGMARVTKRSA